MINIFALLIGWGRYITNVVCRKIKLEKAGDLS